MTHDELLIEINRRLDVALYNGDAQSVHALRAVVELHKPRYMGCGENDCCGPDMCECGDALPCLTIEAIEKELE
jgi:hypothetical protein